MDKQNLATMSEDAWNFVRVMSWANKYLLFLEPYRIQGHLLDHPSDIKEAQLVRNTLNQARMKYDDVITALRAYEEQGIQYISEIIERLQQGMSQLEQITKKSIA